MKIGKLFLVVVMLVVSNSFAFMGLGAGKKFKNHGFSEKEKIAFIDSVLTVEGEQNEKRLKVVKDEMASECKEAVLEERDKLKNRLGIVSDSLVGYYEEVAKGIYKQLSESEVKRKKLQKRFDIEKMHRRYIKNRIPKFGTDPMGNREYLQKKYPKLTDSQIDSMWVYRLKEMIHRFNVPNQVDSMWCRMLDRWLLGELQFEEAYFCNGDFAEEMGFSWTQKKIKNVVGDFEEDTYYLMFVLPEVKCDGKYWRFGIIDVCGNPFWQFFCPEGEVVTEFIPDTTRKSVIVRDTTYEDTLIRRPVYYDQPIPEKPIVPDTSGIRVKPELNLYAGLHDGIFRDLKPRYQLVGGYAGGIFDILFGKWSSPFSIGPHGQYTHWDGITGDYLRFRGEHLGLGVIFDWTFLKDKSLRGVRFNIAPMYGWVWNAHWHPYDSLVQDQAQRSITPSILTTFNFWNKYISFESYLDVRFDVHQTKIKGDWRKINGSSEAFGWKFFVLTLGDDMFRLGVQQKNFHFSDGNGWSFAVGPVVGILSNSFKIGGQWVYRTKTKWVYTEGYGFDFTVEWAPIFFFQEIRDRRHGGRNKEHASNNNYNVVDLNKLVNSPPSQDNDDIWGTDESWRSDKKEEVEASSYQLYDPSKCKKFTYADIPGIGVRKVCR